MRNPGLFLLIGLLAATSVFAAAPHAPVDPNGDGKVGAADLDLMRSLFFSKDARADLNRDGRVDFADLALLKSAVDGPARKAIETPPAAPSVFLLPETQSVTVGDRFVVDLYWDFTGEATIGGGTDILWDPAAFSLVSIVFDDNFGTGPGQFDPAFTRCDNEICSFPGVIDGLATGNFNGLGNPGPIYIASITFDTLSTGTSSIALAQDTGIAGPFISAVDFSPYPNISFAGADIDVAPLPAPGIVIVPAEVDFPDTVVGDSASVPARISNVGGLPLTIGTIFSPQPPFSITADGCSGVVLAPTEGCDMTLAFSPTAAGQFAGIMAVNSDDPVEPELNVVVRGDGIPVPVPDIRATALVLFDPVRIGQTSSAVVGVANRGTAPLVIGAIASANPLEAPFSIVVDSCSNQTLTEDEECVIAMRFAPTAIGNAVGDFDIPSNDPDTPSQVVHALGHANPKFGLAAGLQGLAGRCTNLDTGQSVAAPLGGGNVLPCEALGLLAGGTDDVQLIMRGTATSASSLVGQGLSLDNVFGRCTNETTGQSVIVSGGADSDFNCVSAGLTVTPGDTILLTVRGDVI